MVKLSAGLLPYRRAGEVEVLIAHPGGPYWAKKDLGHWSLVKGEVLPGEEPIAAALREFREETGWMPPDGGWIDLGEITMRSGKVVTAWGVEADFDLASFAPGVFSMLWRGRRHEFPEVDRVLWCRPDNAASLLNPAQVPLLERLMSSFDH